MKLSSENVRTNVQMAKYLHRTASGEIIVTTVSLGIYESLMKVMDVAYFLLLCDSFPSAHIIPFYHTAWR